MPALPSSFFNRSSAARYLVPHAALSERWLLVVHAAVTAAFVIIRQSGFDLQSAGENAITEKLEEVLVNDLLHKDTIEDFDETMFVNVTRGSEAVDFSGKYISKKPDLVFHLRRENELWDQRQHAIFVECKPVDRAHSLPQNYCAVGTDRVGIERFVIGHYAWAMQEAMLIGYVRDGFRVEPHLAKSLAAETRHEKLGSPDPPEAVVFSSGDGSGMIPLYRTKHKRLFTWKENGRNATPIMLYHSWHDCC